LASFGRFALNRGESIEVDFNQIFHKIECHFLLLDTMFINSKLQQLTLGIAFAGAISCGSMLPAMAGGNNGSNSSGTSVSNVTGTNVSNTTGTNTSNSTGTNASNTTGTNASNTTGTNASNASGTDTESKAKVRSMIRSNAIW
jgi:hypothetical protein